MTWPGPHLPARHEFYGKPCPYCGVAMKHRGERLATRDHKLARSNGGRLTAENRIIVCKKCNAEKGSYTLGEWHERLRQAGDPRAPLVWAVLAQERS